MWRSVPEPIPNTCDWIFGDETYTTWLLGRQQSESLLWIESPPGFGKTVIARFLVEHHRKRRDAVAVCCFFCNSNIDAQKHGTSILCSLLH